MEQWPIAPESGAALVLPTLRQATMAKCTTVPDNGQIDIHVQSVSARVRIGVSDTGIGIAQEDWEEIFEIFGQTHRSLDRASGGMGLGLPLARRLAQWHGGSLDVHSEGISKGSEFVLILQRAQPPHFSTVAKDSSDAVGQPLDIVVIDDNADAADALTLYCQMSGHTVRTAYRSVDALRMVSERKPDVVLSDIGLPEIDGFALVREIKKTVKGKPPSFVAITGYGAEQDRLASFEAGFDEHFSKPVDLEKLELALSGLRSGANDHRT